MRNFWRPLFWLWLSFLLLFSAHRFLSWPYLAETPEGNTLAWFFVGTLSDIWIAFLAMVIGSGLGFISFACFRSQKAYTSTLFICFWTFGIITALHQPYVEFFRFQFVPAHFSYLYNPEFIRANGIAGVSPTSMLLALIVVILSIGFMKVPRFLPEKRGGMAMTALLLFCLLSHNRNIEWRVQWYVPSEMSVHFLERLYFHLKAKGVPEPLHPTEQETLHNQLKITQTKESLLINDVVKPMVKEAPPSPAVTKLTKQYQQQLTTSEPPIILVVLLESHRPAEVGAYYPGQPSLSPTIDQLSKEGILFKQAFSTGTVTRGGQEAVFCGYLSGRNNSMMKERRDVKEPCITETFPGQSIWFHGGHGKFDNQRNFWATRGVDHLMSAKDFEKNTPQTSWGYSDVALYKKSIQQLATITQQNPRDPILGMILSLTNHIPWDLPKDCPKDLRKQAHKLSSPKHGTSLYADYALGVLIKGLKKAKLWQRSLVFVVSDHGVAGEPYHQIPAPYNSIEYLKSHIVMLLAGGLVERAGLAGTNINQTVSQADIAPLIAWITGQPNQRFMGEMLLTRERKRPVVVDLGGKIFDPDGGTTFSNQTQLIPPQRDLPLSQRTTLSYYRAVLNYINGKGAQSDKSDGSDLGSVF